MPHLLDFLKSAQPDVLCLQEIKCLESDFPRLEVASLGYQVEAIGQRAYNGVALVSKHPARDIVLGAPDAEVRVASTYLPNGNPSSNITKSGYKLGWMDRLIGHAGGLLRREMP